MDDHYRHTTVSVDWACPAECKTRPLWSINTCVDGFMTPYLQHYFCDGQLTSGWVKDDKNVCESNIQLNRYETSVTHTVPDNVIDGANCGSVASTRNVLGGLSRTCNLCTYALISSR